MYLDANRRPELGKAMDKWLRENIQDEEIFYSVWGSFGIPDGAVESDYEDLIDGDECWTDALEAFMRCVLLDEKNHKKEVTKEEVVTCEMIEGSFGCMYGYGYYAAVLSNGKIEIGESRHREGGVLYCGEYKGDDTPYMMEIKEENKTLYGNIVKRFE